MIHAARYGRERNLPSLSSHSHSLHSPEPLTCLDLLPLGGVRWCFVVCRVMVMVMVMVMVVVVVLVMVMVMVMMFLFSLPHFEICILSTLSQEIMVLSHMRKCSVFAPNALGLVWVWVAY